MRRIESSTQSNCNKFDARVTPARQPMFERSDNMETVASQSAMVAIV
jgi:hypothetical protein